MQSTRSRLKRALLLFTPEERQRIVDGLKLALKGCEEQAKPVNNAAEQRVPPGVTERVRSLRKGTQSRYHRSRGMHHMPAMNHYLSNDKFNQRLYNRLLQAMLERSGVSK